MKFLKKLFGKKGVKRPPPYNEAQLERDYQETQKQLRRSEKLERMAKKEGGKVLYDKQYGAGVQVSAFHFIAEDGTHIYEWP